MVRVCVCLVSANLLVHAWNLYQIFSSIFLIDALVASFFLLLLFVFLHFRNVIITFEWWLLVAVVFFSSFLGHLSQITAKSNAEAASISLSPIACFYSNVHVWKNFELRSNKELICRPALTHKHKSLWLNWRPPNRQTKHNHRKHAHTHSQRTESQNQSAFLYLSTQNIIRFCVLFRLLKQLIERKEKKKKKQTKQMKISIETEPQKWIEKGNRRF